jgi:hypothetical protein
LTGPVTKSNVVWMERGSSGGNILDGGGLRTVEVLRRVVSELLVSYCGGSGGATGSAGDGAANVGRG